jgi:hypothetical protein
MGIIKRAGQQQRLRLVDPQRAVKWCRSSLTDSVAEVKIQLPDFCAITSLNLSATVSGVSARVKWREVHSYQ